MKQELKQSGASSKEILASSQAQRIRELEAKLAEAELKAEVFSTMIEIAERELNISIRKKVQYPTLEELKKKHPHMGLKQICKCLGLSRQAYYQRVTLSEEKGVIEKLVLEEVRKIRELHKRMGTRKLHNKLQPFLLDHKICLGRDALFRLLAANSLLIKPRKRIPQTTNSAHGLKKYANLIQGFTPTAPDQLWVSDITYWKISGTFFYLTLITDAYSRKIIGYHLAENLKSLESVKALNMALSNKIPSSNKLIHHSDRGIQYCSKVYTKVLEEKNIAISMSTPGNPLSNAMAERLNGILKNEYLHYHQAYSLEEAQDYLQQSVHLYNQERPHQSLAYKTPLEMYARLPCVNYF